MFHQLRGAAAERAGLAGFMAVDLHEAWQARLSASLLESFGSR